jgi:hypothetical protein
VVVVGIDLVILHLDMHQGMLWKYLIPLTTASTYDEFSSAPGFDPAVSPSVYQQTLGRSMGMALEPPGAYSFIPFIVDTESGSKLRSEKRRKNAEESARFRKRKKERELQTSKRVAELEQKLKEVEEERHHS